jgi:hypothetical protein
MFRSVITFPIGRKAFGVNVCRFFGNRRVEFFFQVFAGDKAKDGEDKQIRKVSHHEVFFLVINKFVEEFFGNNSLKGSKEKRKYFASLFCIEDH